MMILEKLMNDRNLVVYKEIKDDSIYITIGLAGWNKKKSDAIGYIASVPISKPDLDVAIADIMLWNLAESLKIYEKE